MEVDLSLQNILKSIHIPNKKTPRKKAVVMKDDLDENEKSEKARKNIHCVVRILKKIKIMKRRGKKRKDQSLT